MTDIPAAMLSTMSADSIATLERLARQRGYSNDQITLLKMRHAAAQKKAPIVRDTTILPEDSLTFTDTVADNGTPDSAQLLEEQKRQRAEYSRYFGYSLFDKTPEFFKPNATGPVDPGYLIGPGDVLRLSVWGEVEFQYELTVSKEGKIFIPVAGQLFVSGIPFEKLQIKIQSILSKYYSGLAATPQKTFFDLSVARIRPIRVFVMGEVASPGGYTISSSSTAFNALYAVGGPLLSGSLRNIKVLRDQKELTVVDIYSYLSAGACSTDVRLQNDDVVFIPRREKTVAIFGSVVKPAIYELTSSENLTALLTYCGGIQSKSNIEQALVYRVVPFAQRDPYKPAYNVTTIDLQKYINGNQDFPLFDNDTINIVPLSDDTRNIAVLRGEVRYPGVYQSDNLSVHSLIFKLGKLIDSSSYTLRADLIRLNNDGVTTTIIPVDLTALKTDSAAHDLPLEPFDEVVIYKKSVEKPTDLMITINGEVQQPGTYHLSINQTAADAILQAGGFTREAYRQAIDIFRISHNRTISDTLAEVFKIILPDSLNFTDRTIGSFCLRDRDRIVVRPDPTYLSENYVSVEGLVQFRGKYALKVRGERISSVIARAGGLLPDAFLPGATIIRDKKRVVINFSEALSGTSSRENILLQKNDSIYIPVKPNTVLISGNVNNPGLFSYVQELKVRSYIERAGGLADSSRFILLKKPGGESAKIRKISLKNPPVPEGAEIIVMKKAARDKSAERQGPSIAEVIRDTLAILASAVTVIGLAIQFSR